MNFIRRIIDFFRREYGFPEEPESWENVVFDRGSIDFDDDGQRREYVTNCLEQLKEATLEVDGLKSEYEVVTAQLKDMEDIEALPADEMAELQEIASRIANLNDFRSGLEQRGKPMDDNAFQRIDALYDQIEGGIDKLKEAEGYHVKIKQDMKYLTGEKDAYFYRKHELSHLIEDLRAMMVVCLTAVTVCVLLLIVLQAVFDMDTRIGYLLAAGAAAVGITYIFVRNNDAKRDLKRVEKSINKIILLHNNVKIRYYNNTNLLEYLRIKYGVKNSDELKKLNEEYLAEKQRREDVRNMEKDMGLAERELLRLLRGYRLSDPLVWIHQPAALLDKREMVEVRHNLIIRRQSLRKRLEYNRDVAAKKAQDEIKELVLEYPRYTKEILAMVAEYEKEYT
ncbi:MAG: hypothetical protein LBI54_08670 [Lachnospiraceae bacterium]|jgi:hypothetical protein|nr:hypothetical protein [Lachnospiraceae bacterium]